MAEELDHLKEKRRRRLSQKKDRRKEEYRRVKNKRNFRNGDSHHRERGDWK